MSTSVDTRPVGPADLTDLARLFDSTRNTRGCWCMANCSTRTQFAADWLLGGNRRRFESLAAAGRTPMGILATAAGESVGWCACGPRSRYEAAIGGRSSTRQDRVRPEGAAGWLLPCLFVRADHRGQGITHALVRAAVDLARREGAPAIEGWPLAAAVGRSPDAFVGREQVFADLGFDCVDRPSPNRVIMRLELAGT